VTEIGGEESRRYATEKAAFEVTNPVSIISAGSRN
jgi:hypothetical protein